MNERKKYLTRSRIFGYSIWNTYNIPTFNQQIGIFVNVNYPYTSDEEVYVSDDLINILFGSSNFIGYGECIEITLDVKG